MMRRVRQEFLELDLLMVRMCDESEAPPLTLLPVATEFVVFRLEYKDYLLMWYLVSSGCRDQHKSTPIAIALPACALDRMGYLSRKVVIWKNMTMTN